MRGGLRRLSVLGCVIAATLCAAPAEAPSFSKQVAPILTRSCAACHGAGQQMSALDLSSRAAALKGGQKSGPAIVPGNAAASPFYRRITGADQPAMPLGGKLSAAEIAILKQWIDAGAPWDATADPGDKVFTDQQRN